MGKPCSLCGEKTGGEAILLDYQRMPFWFCCLGCLASWVERKMDREPEPIDLREPVDR